MNQRSIASIAILAAALSFSLTAGAAGPDSFKRTKVTVQYYDLDVHSYAGARTLYSRLQRASRKACALRGRGISSLREVADAKRCYAESLSAAVEKIDSEALTQLHSS